MTRHLKPLTTEVDRFRTEAVRIERLTSQERTVSILVAEGLTNKQIGERLFISAVTARHHLSSIFRKLGISSRFELIVLCYRHQMVVPPVLAVPPAETRAAIGK